jgi:hypothetical protein
MDATVVPDQLTEQLIQKLEESRFLHIPLMNRIEGRIRTKEQLTTYTAVLVHKLEGRNFQDEWLIERINHVLDLQQRLARYESSVRLNQDSTRRHRSAVFLVRTSEDVATPLLPV